MGHTWSADECINSHPHVDHQGKFALVHNGIIENYLPLKEELQTKGVKFKSQTDTEVIVNLLSFYYAEMKQVKPALERTLARLEGTWGLVILCVDKPNTLYCARHGSPLLIGLGRMMNMLLSLQNRVDSVVVSM